MLRIIDSCVRTVPKVKVKLQAWSPLTYCLDRKPACTEWVWQVLVCRIGPVGRGMGSLTQSNLRIGCPRVCTSLSRVVVGYWVASETRLDGGEARVLVASSPAI